MQHVLKYFADHRPEGHSAILRRSVCWVTLIGLSFFLASVPTQSRSEEDLWGGKRTFAAELSADNQLTLTNSNATGKVKIVFDIATKTMTWDISYKDLTSPPTAIRLHGPAQPGTNAAPIIDLSASGLQSPIKGRAAIAAGHVQYMLLGWTYVSISTQGYPAGEIRGKVDVVTPVELMQRRTQPR